MSSTSSPSPSHGVRVEHGAIILPHHVCECEHAAHTTEPPGTAYTPHGFRGHAYGAQLPEVVRVYLPGMGHWALCPACRADCHGAGGAHDV